jgi:DUF1707 SHOCT-like domain/Domain of unknown function (DUF4190)
MKGLEENTPMTAPDNSQVSLADPGPASPPVSRARVSDADREHTIGVLREGFAEGRLTAEEHIDRVGQAYAARTYAELAAASADLPAGSSASPPAPRSGAPATSLAPAAHRQTNSLAIAALVCSLIPGLPQLAAIAMGIAALRQVRRTSQSGATLAAAALIIATLGLLVTVLLMR